MAAEVALKVQSMMTSLRDRVTVKTPTKTAVSTVDFFHSINVYSIKFMPDYCVNNTNFDSFQCDEEVVNKFKFACDKFLLRIPRLIQRYLIT